MSRILVPIALLISSIGLYFSYISPTYSSLLAHKELEKRLLTARADLETFESKKESISAQYESMRKTDLDRVTQMLPDDVDAVQTIIDIDNLASANSLRIDSFDLPSVDTASTRAPIDATVVSAPMYMNEQFGVAFSGGYQNLKNFMIGIESSLALMDVTQFSIDATESADTIPGEYQYQVTFNTYRLQ